MFEKISDEMSDYVLEQIENSMNRKQNEMEICEDRNFRRVSYLWLANHKRNDSSRVNLTDDQKYILKKNFIELTGEEIKASLNKLEHFLNHSKGISGNEVYFIILTIFKDFQNQNQTITTRNNGILASMRIKKIIPTISMISQNPGTYSMSRLRRSLSFFNKIRDFKLTQNSL